VNLPTSFFSPHPQARWPWLAVLLLISACAGRPELREVDELLAQGQRERALTRLEQARRANPNDADIVGRAERETEAWVVQLLAEAEQAIQSGDLERANNRFEAALRWVPNQPRAVAGVQRVRLARKHEQIAEQAARLSADNPALARALLQEALGEDPRNRKVRRVLESLDAGRTRDSAAPPQLAAAFRKPVTVSFRDQPLLQALDVVAHASGLNFVFDKDVQAGLKTTIFARDLPAQDVVDMMLRSNQLVRHTLSETTVLVYPRTPEKEREYRELTMRVFYLSNAEPRALAASLKAMTRVKDIQPDERLNAIIVRDTPEVLQVIERLVAAQDIAQSEVVLELQVLEVNSSDMLDFGVGLPASIGVSPIGATRSSNSVLGSPQAGTLTLDELSRLNRGSVLVNLGSPSLNFNINQTRGNSKLLANPRIRVKNREKAAVTIGDRVPVVTTTTNLGVTGESVAYQDVGLTVKVEPNLTQDDEIGVKISLEVSNIVRTITTKSGLIAYQIGQRKAETVMTSRDGETQVLAGLISNSNSVDAAGLPGAVGLPLLDRMMGTRKDSSSRSEVVLLVTPRIVRSLPTPAPHLRNFNAGTENEMSTQPLRLRPNGQVDVAPPSSAAPAAVPSPLTPASPELPASAPVAPAAPAAVSSPPAPETRMRRAGAEPSSLGR